jgi:ribosomal protein S18 acetylase RimI-like enzyme
MVDIRTATTADAEALCALLVQLPVAGPGDVPLPRAHDVLREILADPDRRLFVACAGDDIVGTADVVVLANLTHGGRPYANVENVVVDASARGRGIGRAVMDAVLTFARERGCYKVQLQSNEQRAPAHALYESLGFEPVAKGYRLYF